MLERPGPAGVTLQDWRVISQKNSRTVNELGLTAAALTDNSDVLMRFSHYLVPHKKRILFCPECSGHELNITPIDDLKNNSAQITYQSLVDDAEEIRKGVLRIRSNLANQRHALLFTLSQLRRQSSDCNQVIVRGPHSYTTRCVWL